MFQIANNIYDQIPSYTIAKNGSNLRVISTRQQKNGNNKLTNNKSNKQKPLQLIPEQPQPLPKPAASPRKLNNQTTRRSKKEAIEPEIASPETRQESTPVKTSSDSGVDSLRSDPLQNALDRKSEGVSMGLHRSNKVEERRKEERYF